MTPRVTFVDGVVEARPVRLLGNLEPLTGNAVLGQNLGLCYDRETKTLICEAHLFGRRIEIHGIDATALEAEAIAAKVLCPVERGGYHTFTPRVGTSYGFHTVGPATMLRTNAIKVTVKRGDRLEFPADAYLGIFPTRRKRAVDNLFRLRALVGSQLSDVHIDIVVPIPDLLMALTRVGHFEAISHCQRDCVVSLRHRLNTPPRASFDG